MKRLYLKSGYLNLPPGAKGGSPTAEVWLVTSVVNSMTPRKGDSLYAHEVERYMADRGWMVRIS